jgi:hypothetical protein
VNDLPLSKKAAYDSIFFTIAICSAFYPVKDAKLSKAELFLGKGKEFKGIHF